MLRSVRLGTLNVSVPAAVRLPRALLLLERAITLDPELGEKVDGRVGQLAFVKSLIDTQPDNVREIARQAVTVGLWKVFVMKQVTQAVHERDLTAFVGELQPWLHGGGVGAPRPARREDGSVAPLPRDGRGRHARTLR
jgi:hypothetical protein